MMPPPVLVSHTRAEFWGKDSKPVKVWIKFSKPKLVINIAKCADMFSLSVALFSLMNSGVMPPPDAFRDLNLSERSFTVWKTQEIDCMSYSRICLPNNTTVLLNQPECIGPIDIQRALGIFAHWDDQWMDLVRDNEEDDDAAKRKLLGWLGFQASKAPTFGSMQDPGQLKRAIEMSNPKAHEVHPYSSASSPAS
eukprot:m.19386 g.19386  ORF g.19386 m.19386 type:complete len:194 (+) comp10895_c0_seq27:1716-2297(+)